MDSCKNSVGKLLFKLMQEKKSNLCPAVDLTDREEFLSVVREVGEESVAVKTHVDLVEGFDSRLVGELKDLSKDLDFLIFEDRKFADIGNTVKLQYSSGTYKIVEWAHLVNAHSLPGPGIVKGLMEAAEPFTSKGVPRGLLLLAQMTPEGNLFTEDYARSTVEIAKRFPEFCTGFIGTGAKPEKLKHLRSLAPKEMLIFTPGIKMSAGGDSLGQQYNSPELAVKNGADVIIVGRGIYGDAKPGDSARKYRKEGWKGIQGMD